MHTGAGQTQHGQSRSGFGQRTTMVVQEQIQTKFPTLVLKLKQRVSNLWNGSKPRNQKLSDLSSHELEEFLAANLQDFKQELMNNIDYFHQMILSARPNPGDPENYQNHMKKYQELLQLANRLMQRMQQSFNEILTAYRKHIDHLWTAICEGQDVRDIQRQFEQRMEENMARYWKPVFDEADRLIAEINRPSNHSSERLTINHHVKD